MFLEFSEKLYPAHHADCFSHTYPINLGVPTQFLHTSSAAKLQDPFCLLSLPYGRVISPPHWLSIFSFTSSEHTTCSLLPFPLSPSFSYLFFPHFLEVQLHSLSTGRTWDAACGKAEMQNQYSVVNSLKKERCWYNFKISLNCWDIPSSIQILLWEIQRKSVFA